MDSSKERSGVRGCLVQKTRAPDTTVVCNVSKALQEAEHPSNCCPRSATKAEKFHSHFLESRNQKLSRAEPFLPGIPAFWVFEPWIGSWMGELTEHPDGNVRCLCIKNTKHLVFGNGLLKNAGCVKNHLQRQLSKAWGHLLWKSLCFLGSLAVWWQCKGFRRYGWGKFKGNVLSKMKHVDSPLLCSGVPLFIS